MKKISEFLDKVDIWLDETGSKLDKKTFGFNPDLIGSILFLAVALVFLFLMPGQIKVTETTSVNAQTFPKVVFYTILVLSAVSLIKEIYKIAAKKKCARVEVNALHEVRALIIFALILGYFFLLKLVGFYVSSVLFGIGMTAYFRIRKVSYYVIVSCAAIVIAVVFKNILNVRLP